MQTRLWSLTLSNFAIGTGVMIVPGMLNELSADLAISPAQVGMLISAFAMTICVTGPFLAGWTSAIERRKLLAGALMLYAVMHWIAALLPGYNTLLVACMLTVLGAAVFTAQAAATAGLMVPPEVRGKAIGLVFLGWWIAAVIGNIIGARVMDRIGSMRVGVAPPLASASVSLNSSAIYLGQAAGAFVGGLIVSTQGTSSLSFFGALPMAAAIIVSLYAGNLATRRRMVEAA